MRLGKLQKEALKFAITVAEGGYGWQSYNQEQCTKTVIHSLYRHGLVEVNMFNQFRIKSYYLYPNGKVGLHGINPINL